ncbi:MAG TPA: signal peptidase I, partial [Solirubrobacteraceae bacterium]
MKRALRVLAGVVSGFTLVLAVCLSAPRLTGGHAFTEMSGSMAPALTPGDVLLVDVLRARDAHVGEIVTFPDPLRRGRLLTHRVRSVSVDGDVARFVTRGDANNSVERWSVKADGRIGRVTHRVPKLGYGLVHLRGGAGSLLLISVPSTLLGA